ncbi:MAG: hypothetical protein BGO67_05400 [Alphaproteobacteria bacterium 41-28]|nr:MAG: hypothetical protein BGO67_05400 [Alphaproteobacteria bacterium 41-28]
MIFFKHSLLVSTSLLLGIHSLWAMEDGFGKNRERQGGAHVKKRKDLGNYSKKNVGDDAFC